IRRFVRVAVPALVGCCVVQPKIRAKVDKGNALIENRLRDPLAMSVRKGCEDKIDSVERSVAELLKHRAREDGSKMRVDERDRLPGLALAEHLRRHDLRMRGNQPQQLAADIARGSKDGRPNHEAAPIHWIAYLCKCMHIHAYD